MSSVLAQTWVRKLMLASAAAGLVLAGEGSARAAYIQTNLVSDIPGLAQITDLQLVNPWGVSESATSPFWVSNQGTSNSTLYTVTGATNVSKVNINPPSGFVTIPTTTVGPQGPTGQVSNSNSGAFAVGNGGNGQAARFIFADLNGTISAWNGRPEREDPGDHARRGLHRPGHQFRTDPTLCREWSGQQNRRVRQ